MGRAEFERFHGIDCKVIVARLRSTWFRFAQEVK
jgi:hypothetical protein